MKAIIYNLACSKCHFVMVKKKAEVCCSNPDCKEYNISYQAPEIELKESRRYLIK